MHAQHTAGGGEDGTRLDRNSGGPCADKLARVHNRVLDVPVMAVKTHSYMYAEASLTYRFASDAEATMGRPVSVTGVVFGSALVT